MLKELRPRDWQSQRQAEAYAETLSLVDVDQFFGIELGEFPARIAETALWMMDHIMNNRLSLEFGRTYARIPLESSPHIVHGDALEMDWSGLLKPEDCSFVLGNPPFVDAGGLADPHLTVREASRPINGMGKLIIGSKPIDGGRYIFNAGERAEFMVREPGAAAYLRPYVGAREYLRRGERWLLALHDAPPEALARMAGVRAYREGSKSAPTRRLAETPTLYHVNVLPTAPFLVIPEVSSDRRDYVPIGWLEPPTIPSNLVRILQNAKLTDFALLTSAMHMTWLRHVAGRLKSDYRYSIGLVYNTFPTPPGFMEGTADLSGLEPLAQAVLDARAAHQNATLANLYDPDLTATDLRRAHRAVDRAVDRLYLRRGFASERQPDRAHVHALREDPRAAGGGVEATNKAEAATAQWFSIGSLSIRNPKANQNN